MFNVQAIAVVVLANFLPANRMFGVRVGAKSQTVLL